MSSKAGTSKQSLQAKSPSKTIITRHNSHKMQRQLRNKDRSMKNITKLLKGAPRNVKGLNLPSRRLQKVSKQSNSQPDYFKLDDITNVPLTKSIRWKHVITHFQPTVQPTKPVRPIKCKVKRSIQTKPITSKPVGSITPKSKPTITTKPAESITPKPAGSITSKPARPIIPKPMIDTLQPNVTIRCVKRKKQIQINESKSQQMNQFHPCIEKRQIMLKDDWLKPKHEYKTVCRVKGVVRRKLYVPRKGIEPQRSNHRVPQSVSKDLDIKELVQLVDDEGLNDADLMEILTCPSPVWWENPGDEEYLEDAIPIQIAVDTRFIAEELFNKNLYQEKHDKLPLLDVKIDKSDKKFMQKRSKLEKLLGNMKSNLPSNDILGSDNINRSSNDDDKRHGDKRKLTEEHINRKENGDASKDKIEGIEHEILNNDVGNKVSIFLNKKISEDISIIKNVHENDDDNNCKELIEVIDISCGNDEITTNKDIEMHEYGQENISLSKTLSTSDIEDITDTENVNNDSDSNINNKEITTEDENNEMETSIENTDKIIEKEYTNVDIISVKNGTKRNTESRTSMSSDDMCFESFPEEMLSDLENLNIPIEKDVIVIIDDDIRSDQTLSSPISSKSVTSDPVTEDNIDSISDTNIKFITEENTIKTMQSSNTSDTNELEPKEKEVLSKNDTIRMRIKDTYKELMKNMARNNVSYVSALLDESKSNTEDTETKTVSDGESIKYCFKCSSILNIDNCQYCSETRSNDSTIILD